MVFAPGMLAWTERFLGQAYVDAWGTQWFYWWVGRQLSLGEGPGHTDVLFFPWGKDVYLHTGGNILDSLAALPFRWVLGPVAGYNAFVLAVSLANALAFRRLAVGWRLSASAATFAGALFALNPYVLHELRDGRPTQALLAPMVMFFHELFRTVREPGARPALAAGAWLAVTGLAYWFYAFFAGVAALAVAAVALRRSGERRRLLGMFVVAAGTGILLLLPFALPMIAARAAVPGLLEADAWTLSGWMPATREGVSVGIYVFSPLDRGSGFVVPLLDEPGRLVFIPEDTTVFWTQLLLAGVGLALAGGPLRAMALALVGASALVVVGPSLDLGPIAVPNVFYLAMMKAVPLLRRLWWPQRALAVAAIGLAMLAAVAFAAIEARGRRAWLAGALAVAVAWAVELRTSALAPLDTWSAAVPEAFRCLTQGPAGAILELPYAGTQAHLYYQTIHGRSMFGGMVEDNVLFTPVAQVDFRERNTFVRALLRAADPEGEVLPVTAADRAAVGDLGYRYVVLDKTAFEATPDPAARVDTRHEGPLRGVRKSLTTILGPPAWEDADTALWAPWGGGSPCGAAR